MYFIGCFFGYLIETFMKLFVWKSMHNGVLLGPWIPVYGFGILISIFISEVVFKLKIKKCLKIWLLFIFIFFITTLFEWLGGILIEAVFHKTFWNYEKFMFNIGPYISVEMSLIWSCLLLIFTFYLRPLLDLGVKKIPRSVTLILLGIQLIDFIITWIIL